MRGKCHVMMEVEIGSHAAASQGMSKMAATTRSYWTGKEGYYLELQKQHDAADILISNSRHQKCQSMQLCCFEPLIL